MSLLCLMHYCLKFPTKLRNLLRDIRMTVVKCGDIVIEIWGQL